MSAAIYGVRSGKKVLLFGREELWWSDCEHPEVENYPGNN